MLQLGLIILALALGYICHQLPVNNAILSKCLTWLTILILLFMGYHFGAHTKHLLHELITLGKIVGTFTLCLLIANVLFIGLFFHFYHGKSMSYKNIVDYKLNQYSRYLLDGMKYLAWVIVGILLGALFHINVSLINFIVNALLLVILFIIGIQLKRQSISLLTVFTNRTGLLIALLIIISSWLAGLLAALLLGLHAKIGLILSSGFGWYTLTGILTGQLVSHQLGTAAFFIDFLREMIAIIMIPLLGKNNSLISIGYCGATALDFTLPILQTTLGEHTIPIAVSSGLLLTIVVPLLIPILAQVLF